MLKDDSYTNVAANVSVLSRLMSRLDDQPVKVQDEFSLLDIEAVGQKQSLIGPA